MANFALRLVRKVEQLFGAHRGAHLVIWFVRTKNYKKCDFHNSLAFHFENGRLRPFFMRAFYTSRPPLPLRERVG